MSEYITALTAGMSTGKAPPSVCQDRLVRLCTYCDCRQSKRRVSCARHRLAAVNQIYSRTMSLSPSYVGHLSLTGTRSTDGDLAELGDGTGDRRAQKPCMSVKWLSPSRKVFLHASQLLWKSHHERTVNTLITGASVSGATAKMIYSSQS